MWSKIQKKLKKKKKKKEIIKYKLDPKQNNQT